MKIGLLGFGAINNYIYDKIVSDSDFDLVFVFDANKEATNDLDDELVISSLDEMPKVDLVVEAASHKAVTELGKTVLEKTNLLILSVGALANQELYESLKETCEKNGTKLYIPTGAIIGIDGIESVKDQLTSVQIETRKSPKSLGREDTTETVLFDGNARKGCVEFPKNINVAATLSLNGVGFDETKARIISDPNCDVNSHTITAEGDFGKFIIKVEATKSKNPKTSKLAAITTWNLIKKIRNGLQLF